MRALGRLTRLAEKTATVAAVGGGLLVLAIAGLVTVSVLGRWLFNKPIPADFEFVEIGVGIAVFAFLSYTQMRGGHIAVDTFTQRLAPGVNAAIDGIWALVLCAFLALFAWGLASGAIESRQYSETLVQLPWPIWPVYAAASILCTLACISAACSALVKFGADK